jgi:hypothetical protein
MSVHGGLHSPPDVPYADPEGSGATQVVWKWALDLTPWPQRLEVPQGARLLHAELQAGALAMWWLCDPTAEHEQRVFVVAATGQQLTPDWHYACSWVAPGYVWHAFCDKAVTRA